MPELGLCSKVVSNGPEGVQLCNNEATATQYIEDWPYIVCDEHKENTK